jgi:Zn-dependent protease with chaperone function
MDSLGKMLILFGVILALLGGLLLLAGKISFLGRLPGDIVIRREHWSFYFPLTTSIVISILLTLLFSFFSRR